MTGHYNILSYHIISYITLVFSTPFADTQFQGETLQRGRKIQGVGKFLRFSTEIAVYLRNRYEIGPCLLWNVNRKSYALYRMLTFSMTFTDPYPGFQGHCIAT